MGWPFVKDLEVTIRVFLENPDQVRMHKWFTAQDAEETVPMLLRVVNQLVHVVEADQVLRFVHVYPAPLTPEDCSCW